SRLSVPPPSIAIDCSRYRSVRSVDSFPLPLWHFACYRSCCFPFSTLQFTMYNLDKNKTKRQQLKVE
ncbi:hypothetical protein RDWZM_001893, partial [Blomia tropicalis]